MNFWHTYILEQTTFHRVRRLTHADPPWVLKGALLAAGLVLLPMAILLTLGLVAAILLGGMAFLLLRLLNRGLRLLTGKRATSAHEPVDPLTAGRENVRVIQR